MNTSITPEVIQKSYTYPHFKQLLETLIVEGRTTGLEQSEEKIGYTKLNLQRINRSEKTFEATVETREILSSIKDKQNWILIGEAWCGDVSQNIAQLYLLSQLNKNINFYIVLRDDNPSVIDNYQTNGTKSIPKLVILDENLNELAVWGPRPHGALEILKEYKSNPEITKEIFHNNLHLWYARNRGNDLQNEIAAIEKDLLLHA